MTDLGDLPGGEDYSEAKAINDNSQIVGISKSTYGVHGFFWDKGQMIEIGSLPTGSNQSFALAINNSGEVVGNSGDGGDNSRAFIWDGVNGIRNLNDLVVNNTKGYILQEANDINDDGDIVGVARNPLTNTHGFLLKKNGK